MVEVGEFWDSGQGEAEGAGPVYTELLRICARDRSCVRGALRAAARAERPRSKCSVRVLISCLTATPTTIR